MADFGKINSSTIVSVPLLFKRVLTANEVKNSFSSPIELIAAQGSNKVTYIDPYSIVVKESSGTAFNFAASLIYIGNYGNGYFAGIFSHTSINSNDWSSAGFLAGETIANGGFVFPNAMANSAIDFTNDTVDSVNGTRTLSLSFNYYIMDLT